MIDPFLDIPNLLVISYVSWNIGIMAAYTHFNDCWVAILDDDDEWMEDHIRKCLDAATNDNCQWVVSGIIRQGQTGTKHEPLLKTRPSANQFFTTNPGIQGSNIFVRGQCNSFDVSGIFWSSHSISSYSLFSLQLDCF